MPKENEMIDNNELNISYHLSNLKTDEISDKECLELLINEVESRPNPEKLKEALIVRLGNNNKITMFGRQVNDELTDSDKPGRRQYEMHPYGKAGSGVAVMASYTDENNEIHILLSRKYKDMRDKNKGLEERYKLICGYSLFH